MLERKHQASDDVPRRVFVVAVAVSHCAVVVLPRAGNWEARRASDYVVWGRKHKATETKTGRFQNYSHFMSPLTFVMHGLAPVGVSPDPNSQKAEAYVTSNAAEKAAEGVLAVTVTGIEYSSTPTVKLVTLRVLDRNSFRFRPGQWVDFYAPGVDKPGGYSIASSPGRFVYDGTFQIVVRESRSSKSGHWVHEKCKVNDEARVRVGGKFFASTEDVTHPLLLVAGGIGIAPILGMIQTLLEEQLTESSKQSEDRKPKLKAILLCSTKNPRKQPMYREIIDAIKQSKGAVRCVFHITDGELLNPKDRRISPQERNVSTVQGRIDTTALRESLSQLQSIDGEAENISKKKPLAFLCGPPAMSDATEASLLELEMPKADVRLERWW